MRAPGSLLTYTICLGLFWVQNATSMIATCEESQGLHIISTGSQEKTRVRLLGHVR